MSVPYVHAFVSVVKDEKDAAVEVETRDVDGRKKPYRLRVWSGNTEIHKECFATKQEAHSAGYACINKL